jgi:hypothetical protein
VLPSPADAVSLVGIPGRTLGHEPALARQIQEVPRAGDALAVQHVELRLPKRCGHLVPHQLHPQPAAGDLIAV